MPELAINGTTIWYERDGDGVPCLVLHGGLGVDHTLYRKTLQPLTARLELVFIDHRGNGRSGRPPLDTLTIEQLADDAAAVAHELGFDQTLVFGHSYGGFVAQELTLHHPDLVRGLMLIDTTPGQLGTDETEDDYRGPPPPPEFLELVSQLPDSDVQYAEGMTGLMPFYLHRSDVADALAAFDGTIYSRDAMMQGFIALSTWSAVDRLATITAPTLVAVGRHDLFTAAPQADRIADRIPHAERVVFDHSGHFPWFDEPDRFFQILNRWLDELRGTALG